LSVNRDDAAINIYIAMCYFKLEYYDVSSEILTAYLQNYPTSLVAVSLKACNDCQLYGGSTAEKTLLALEKTHDKIKEHAMVEHNLEIFRNDKRRLPHVLPSLYDVIPEARLNMVIYHLNNQEIREAFALLEDYEPTEPIEYHLKGTLMCITRT